LEGSAFGNLEKRADEYAEKVLILTADSRTLVGILAAVDNSTNLVSAP